MNKFILLGHHRTGSTLLSLMLQAHPEVQMYGELFHEDGAERETAFRVGRARWDSGGRTEPYADGEDAWRFLAEEIFRPRGGAGPPAVGYKHFYTHARGETRARDAWRYLTEHRDVLVVHLTRRNLFETFVSLHVAMRTRAWKRAKGDATPRAELPAFPIDPDQCAAFFEEISSYRRWAEEAFARHAVLGLEYERDLCGDLAGTLFRVQDFLGVSRREAPQPLEKQARKAPAEQISNYRELRRYFAGSPYAEFFSS